MKKIIYYVASSIDGYISGPNDDVSRFLYQGNGVEKYLEDLKSFQTVIMGRSTYEFGYKFGVVPGQPSPTYPHMKHYIFSNKLKFDNKSDQVELKPINTDEIIQIKRTSPTDIYLCGGGQFAGWLLENGLIDKLKIKLNPITLGGGTPLFGKTQITANWKLIDSERFDNDLLLLTYEYIK
ncbi:dihydrofolate reductase family protein [Algoriphagus sp. D3-2-R+10]|uniref:dihydrofolate reductase family protein n=1 Tax=Algoriphagus aurantiacus TaxID=3103948 RepID=UPI002B3BC236|nr:dihydrofolate reductase family protein [Algoriphagus sp. D3-2-R+10]MEB2774323.1 dihydrofolate reductase family protein [Algoriphagus sp. D3-2-R+10]